MGVESRDDLVRPRPGSGVGGEHVLQGAEGARREGVQCFLDYCGDLQEGQPVFKFAVTRMADVSEELLKRNQLTGNDIAYLVPHQANKRIIDATANRIGLSDEKVMVNIHRYGNTTAGTIPLCLYDWEDKLKKDDLLVFAAFGGGFTWGATLVKWGY